MKGTKVPALEAPKLARFAFFGGSPLHEGRSPDLRLVRLADGGYMVCLGDNVGQWIPGDGVVTLYDPYDSGLQDHLDGVCKVVLRIQELVTDLSEVLDGAQTETNWLARFFTRQSLAESGGESATAMDPALLVFGSDDLVRVISCSENVSTPLLMVGPQACEPEILDTDCGMREIFAQVFAALALDGYRSPTEFGLGTTAAYTLCAADRVEPNGIIYKATERPSLADLRARLGAGQVLVELLSPLSIMSADDKDASLGVYRLEILGAPATADEEIQA